MAWSSSRYGELVQGRDLRKFIFNGIPKFKGGGDLKKPFLGGPKFRGDLKSKGELGPLRAP